MEFLSGILMVVAGWFGLSATTVESVVAEPVMMVEEMVTATESAVTELVEEGISNPENIVEVDGTTAENTVEPVMTGDIEPAALPVDRQTALVAGGCFWCVEADLEKTRGVISVVSGYAGGSTENPTYRNYGSGGHREVVEVTYDANRLSFEDILIVTLKTTDPTDDDGTFGDRGDKYSSAFYYESPEQKQIIEALIAEVDEFGPYDAPLAIDVEPRPQFWPAEDNHQDYYKGALTKLKYQFYRDGSGRTAFIKKHWGEDTSPQLPWRNQATMNNTKTTYVWSGYQKPDDATLAATMEPLAYRVTQQDGTERAGTSPLDKNWERGIYVDVLSGEPLFSSRDKFDSGTGWPSFVAPITPEAVTAHEDRKLFSVRTETRSAIADNHLGHVFTDGPADRGGLRYCMNGVALRFVPEAEMVALGYEDFLDTL